MIRIYNTQMLKNSHPTHQSQAEAGTFSIEHGINARGLSSSNETVDKIALARVVLVYRTESCSLAKTTIVLEDPQPV